MFIEVWKVQKLTWGPGLPTEGCRMADDEDADSEGDNAACTELCAAKMIMRE